MILKLTFYERLYYTGGSENKVMYIYLPNMLVLMVGGRVRQRNIIKFILDQQHHEGDYLSVFIFYFYLIPILQ